MKHWRWIGLVAACVLVQPAITYGGIWDSRANPTPDVTVGLSDYRVLHGTLTRTWSNEWELIEADGSTVRFEKYDYMSVRPARARPETFDPFRKHWRSSLPVLATAFLALVCLFAATWRDDERSRETKLPSEEAHG